MRDGPDPHWIVPAHDKVDTQRLVRLLGVPTVIARLLLCRDLVDPDAAKAYLSPSLDQLHDPMRMLGMAFAIERIRVALSAGEPILIYGDYDVDGTIATVLLKTAIDRAAKSLGLGADVRYHIPHRIREGYGIQESRIETAAEEGVRLVISVDTGIRAFAAAREAKRLGLDLIVTDHHLPDTAEGVPHAVAVLNPNQPGCDYPYKELCGAAVAFKLAQGLLESTALTATDRETLRTKTLPSFLKLLSIATIADAVPLTGENRVIASLGLIELRRPAQTGLKSLMDLARIDTSNPISATAIGFRLAPRINAAGRMDIASDVVEMFLSRDPRKTRSLAEKLHSLNDDRRAVEADALRDIEERIDKMRTEMDALPACLVLDDPDWHRGVIGILASRVVDRTERPALVLSHEEGQAYGSGRSVAGFHLLDALTAVHSQEDEGLFARFGGHAHAVGFSLPSERVDELRLRMGRHAEKLLLAQEPATATMECDAELRLSEITPAFLASLEKLGPFGNGNREPLFISRQLKLALDIKVVKERHLRLMFEDEETGDRFSGMAWGRRTDWVSLARFWQLSQGSLVDVAYKLRMNRNPDFGGWEFEIVALRPVGTHEGKESLVRET